MFFSSNWIKNWHNADNTSEQLSNGSKFGSSVGLILGVIKKEASLPKHRAEHGNEREKPFLKGFSSSLLQGSVISPPKVEPSGLSTFGPLDSCSL
jgi:hypothetical protein